MQRDDTKGDLTVFGVGGQEPVGRGEVKRELGGDRRMLVSFRSTCGRREAQRGSRVAKDGDRQGSGLLHQRGKNN